MRHAACAGGRRCPARQHKKQESPTRAGTRLLALDGWYPSFLGTGVFGRVRRSNGHNVPQQISSLAPKVGIDRQRLDRTRLPGATVHSSRNRRYESGLALQKEMGIEAS